MKNSEKNMKEKITYLKIKLTEGKKIKEILEYLKKKEYIDKKNKIKKEEKNYIIPLNKKTTKNKETTIQMLKKINEKKIIEEKLTEKNIIEKTIEKKPKSVKEILKPILKEKISLLKSSFDILGRIAIIEETEELKKYNKKIAEAITKIYPEVKSVYIKAGIHEGKYRIQPYKHILGEKNNTTTYIENKTKLYLDIQKTYFTPRLANERLRIAKQIKKELQKKNEKNEKILVLFSGIAPYPIIIEKILEKKELEKIEKIIGVELNPNAHEYAKKNLLLNKTKKIILYNQDAKKFLKEEYEKKEYYNRIIMPLPKQSKYYLSDTIKITQNKGIIHFYYFVEEKKIEEKLKKILEEEIKKTEKETNKKFNYKILNIHKTGQYAPRKYRVCADIQITRKK